jgi:hypothetical protein
MMARIFIAQESELNLMDSFNPPSFETIDFSQLCCC